MKKLLFIFLTLNLFSFGQTDQDYYINGISKFNIKDYTGAIADYNKAIQLNPDYAEAYTNRGRAKLFLKDYTGAIADYNKAIQLKPDYPISYNRRGVAKFYLQDYTGAIADYNKAIQLNPDYADAYCERGAYKSYLKDYTGAIIDINKALQLKPDDVDSYYIRGNAMYYLKDMNGAFADWTKAGELGSINALTCLQNFFLKSLYNQERILFLEEIKIKIGTQTWTSKNLDVTTYRNGDVIPEVKDANAWANLTTGAWCYYENESDNGTSYGKLYNWYAVNDPRGLAPTGYHIPGGGEWTILTTYLGGSSNTSAAFISGVGEKMKSIPVYESHVFNEEIGGYRDWHFEPCPNCADWSSEYRRKNSCHKCKDKMEIKVMEGYTPKTQRKKNVTTQIGGWDGNNSSGFAGLPGGCRSSNGSFMNRAKGYWWTSSGTMLDGAWSRGLSSRSVDVYWDSYEEHHGFSVRCVKD